LSNETALNNIEDVYIESKSGNEYDQVAEFLQQIRSFDVLGALEVRRLARIVESNRGAVYYPENARRRVIESYLSYACAYAIDFFKRKSSSFPLIHRMDFIQQAMVGVAEAVDSWEEDKSNGGFTVHVSINVKRSVIDYLRSHGNPGGSMPASVRVAKKKLRQIFDSCEDGDESFTTQRLAELCDCSVSTILIALEGRPLLDSEIEEGMVAKPVHRLRHHGPHQEDISVAYLDAKPQLEAIKEAIGRFCHGVANGDRNREILEVWLGFNDEPLMIFVPSSQMKTKKLQVLESEIRTGDRIVGVKNTLGGTMAQNSLVPRDAVYKVTQTRIGIKYGISESRICQILKRFSVYIEYGNGPVKLREKVLDLIELVAQHEAKFG